MPEARARRRGRVLAVAAGLGLVLLAVASVSSSLDARVHVVVDDDDLSRRRQPGDDDVPLDGAVAHHAGAVTAFITAKQSHGMTRTIHGVLAAVVFVVGYAAAVSEERIGRGFKKSIPITLAAGAIWLLVALGYKDKGHAVEIVTGAARHNLTEFVEVFLFLLVAMAFVNTMKKLNVFDAIRAWLVESGFSYRACFWITGLIAFCLSPIADNLTTAALMGAVVSSLVGGGNGGATKEDREFVSTCCVNVVVAANAGGAFSPFGDLTTLMVWQRGKLGLIDFPKLFAPALVCWLVPAAAMHSKVRSGSPPKLAASASEPGGGDDDASGELKPGAFVVIWIFVGTVVTTACFHSYAHLPPVLGMMTGLAVLNLYGWWKGREETGAGGAVPGADRALDIFKRLEQTEWDTLIFFFWIISCVGGLGAFGFLREIRCGVRTFFTHPVGSTFDRVPFQLTDELIFLH